MSKDLIIVEFKKEAEYFASRPELMTAGTKVLSLLPEAGAYLKGKGIAYENTLPHFPRRSHEECLSCVDGIIQRINRSVKITDEIGLTHTYLNTLTFYLRHYLSYLVMNMEVIANCIEEHNIERLHVCRYGSSSTEPWELGFNERILSSVAASIAQSFGVEMMEHAIGVQAPEKRLRYWNEALYKMLFNRITLQRPKNSLNTSIFFYSLGFNFERIVQSLENCSFYNIVPKRGRLFELTENRKGKIIHNLHLDYFWPADDQSLSNSLRKMTETLTELHEKEKLFTYKNIDFSFLVMEKIKGDFVKQLKVLNRKVRSLKNILKNLNPSVIVSPMARGLSYALGELSLLLNIPSILISHGSHVPPRDEYARMEWFDHGKGLIDTDYQYHLLQSPWAVKYVEAIGRQKDYYKIKPLIFPQIDRTKKNEKLKAMYPQAQGKKIIMHAGTPKPRGSNRFYIYETLDEYIQNMIDLIDAIKERKDVFLIIRFRPSVYLSTNDLKALLPEAGHYVIASEGSFNDYLTIVDLMVSFSSTTIEEALLNNVPVLQYDRTGRYEHIEGARWTGGRFNAKDSVYTVGRKEDLNKAVSWIIDQHLSIPSDENLFKRHKFDDAPAAEEFIRRLIANRETVHKELQYAMVEIKG